MCERQGIILDSKSRRDNIQAHNVWMLSFQCPDEFCAYLAHELKIMQLIDVSYLLQHKTFSAWKVHAVKFKVFKVVSNFLS